MKKAGELIPMRSDEWNFQIMGPFEQHTVDVLGRSCSCRKKAYELPILGINGPDLWPNVELPPPIPPAIVKRPGRPKKARIRNPTVPPSALPHNPLRLKKHQRSVTCRVCGEHGHNARKHKKADQNEEQEETPVSESQPLDMATMLLTMFSQVSHLHQHLQTTTMMLKLAEIGLRKRQEQQGRESSQLDGNGNEDQGQTVNVTQSEGVTCPVVVKGGVNYITVSNIRAALRPRNGATPGKDNAANK
ncbi:Unknown protein [Striga hermonthica]|uniref:CCHC-type domain-containing protein n=1 Tax=Striga hermonthica TaxID=68872 RepID=A0A9N7RFP7_STRHE|nr:Unknown protein [Striga hermonthica]